MTRSEPGAETELPEGTVPWQQTAQQRHNPTPLTRSQLALLLACIIHRRREKT
jgi:hypothetical protein